MVCGRVPILSLLLCGILVLSEVPYAGGGTKGHLGCACGCSTSCPGGGVFLRGACGCGHDRAASGVTVGKRAILPVDLAAPMDAAERPIPAFRGSRPRDDEQAPPTPPPRTTA